MGKYDDVIHRFERGWRPATLGEAHILRRAVLTLPIEQADLSRRMADVVLDVITNIPSSGVERVLDLAEAYSTAGTAHLPEELGVRQLDIAFGMLCRLVSEIPPTNGWGDKEEIESREVAEPQDLETNVLMQYVRTSERLGRHYVNSDPKKALIHLWDAVETLEWLGKTEQANQNKPLINTIYSIAFNTYTTLSHVLAAHFGDLDLASECDVAALRFGDKLRSSVGLSESQQKTYAMLVAATGGNSKA